MVVRTKTFLFLAILILGLLGLWFFTVRKNEPEQVPKDMGADKRALEVTVKKASDLKSAVFEERLPAVMVPENEAVVTAETSGTVSSVSFEVGSAIKQGALLVRITDPTGSTLSKSGIRSESVRQAEITASSARKSYKEAKRLAEKNTNKESSLARDLAKLRLESAEIDLSNTLDASIVRAPLSGIVSEKNVGVGSSVAQGAAIATIASPGAPQVRFHVSEGTRHVLALGDSIQIILKEGLEEKAHITSIASIADSATGKFPVEARLEKTLLSSGTIGSVIIQTTRLAPKTSTSALFLPLSAITTGQEGSFFFVAENGKAKKIAINTLTVSGETGAVSATLPHDANIIIESGGTLEEGTPISVK